MLFDSGLTVRVEVDQPTVELEDHAGYDGIVHPGPGDWDAYDDSMAWVRDDDNFPRGGYDDTMDWSGDGGAPDWADDAAVGRVEAERLSTILPVSQAQAAEARFTDGPDRNSSGGSIDVQVPDFSLPTQEPLPSQAPQLDTESKVKIRMDRITASRGDCRPVSRTPADRNAFWSKPHSTVPMDGVFARGQFLPFAFHVLGGPMQKQVEISISVSLICSINRS